MLDISKKKLYYWSPGYVHIATFKAVINSAHSIDKYSYNYESSLINFFGEFNQYKEIIDKKKIKLINLFNENILNNLPKFGRIRSRISFLIIFIISFFPLKKLLKNEKPEFLIIHLVSSLPLVLLILFKFKTKFILRISGYPKLGFVRRMLWKIAFKKIYAVTCPTNLTKEKLLKLNIVDEKKLFILYDPIIELKNKKKIRTEKKDYFFSVGRLTKQKNFLFLCKCIKIIRDKFDNKIKLVIAGDGEDRNLIQNYIKNNKLEENIKLIGYKKEIHNYYLEAKATIVSSLWEDPGFVLIEAGYYRSLIISSNCESGPKELIKKNNNGILFENNNINSFIKEYQKYLNLSQKDIKSMITENLKKVRLFTLFNHYKNFNKILMPQK